MFVAMEPGGYVLCCKRRPWWMPSLTPLDDLILKLCISLVVVKGFLLATVLVFCFFCVRSQQRRGRSGGSERG